MHARLNQSLYHTAQYIRGEPVRKALADLNKSFYTSLDELESIQNTRLLELLKHAINTVPFYKKHFQPWVCDINEVNINLAKDVFKKLPVVEKEHILKNRDSFFSTHSFKCVTNISSGTTGEPFAYPCDQVAWAYRHASLIRLIELYEVKFGSRYGYFFGQHWKSDLQIKTNVKDWFFNRDRFSAFNITSDSVLKTFLKFKRNKVVYFLGYPSTLVEFCKIASEELGMNLTELNLKLVITTGETLEEFQRTYLNKILGCPIVNYYGSAEGGFASFEGREGVMQENMETCFLEINENRKISKTDLFLRQFPLIKIQTDDICENQTNTVETQLNHKNLGKISGRTGEKIILPNGEKFHAVILDYFFDLFINDPNVLKFRFEFSKEEVKLVLKSKQEYISDSFRINVEKEFNELFPNVSFRLVKVNEFDHLPNGKNRPWIQR